MSGADGGRGEGGAPPRKEFVVAPRFGGLPAMLGRERFSDLTVRLADGKTVAVNRILLAASSEVLRAKFEAPLRDAAEQEWAPEVGSAAAWEWMLGWMYGSSAPMPSGLFVEVLALADHFQMAPLMEAMAALPIPDCAADLAGQLLDVWACPQVLHRIAQECIPRVAADVGGTISQRLRSAAMPNVALFVKYVQFMSEMDRLSFLCALLRGRDGCPREFPDCFLDAIRWDLLPTEVLASGIFGDLCGLPISATERTRGVFTNALVSRCSILEQKVPPRSMPLGLSARVSKPLPEKPEDGLFTWMVQHKLATEIKLSEEQEPANLFSRTPNIFRINEASHIQEPWIELRAKSLHVLPEGVGLLHGHPATDKFRCQTFVVEAALDDGDWTNLLTRNQQPLGHLPTVLPIQMVASAGKVFNRFRLRMTGDNTGDDSSNQSALSAVDAMCRLE